ncbi:helix-turn-helix domain-containing protein [Chitinophaga sp.]|uniref:winged helix-turn-helix transcriptional regulator n=1 Tax=Chitinophaga sp. TaxID=1869181 RepID=UPI0031D0D1C2
MKELSRNSKEDCLSLMLSVRDALDVINGKWKLLIIISLVNGNKRFREIERSIPKISSKVLAKELKDLEDHKLIKRTAYDGTPVLVEYTATEYVNTLENVILELYAWGQNHRQKIIGKTQ